jgi:DNA primase
MKYSAKWINSAGFSSGNTLYNYWFAKRHIRESGVAILVEGAGDVWRLEENGIHNSIAIFGTNLTDIQKTLLFQTGAMSLVVMTDSDEPGRKAAKVIAEDTEIRRSFRLFFPKFDSKDVGELGTDTITDDIKPLIERISHL